MLVIENLVKSFRHNMALENVNISAKKGQVLGLLGPNGSGKTTFQKIVSGILPYDQGTITIDGEELSNRIKGDVAFLPESNHLYEWMTVDEAIEFYNNYFTDFDINQYEVLSKNLKIKGDKKVTKLTKGNRQQFRLCLTLSRKAKVYLLDEPLNGIDIIARENVMALIRKIVSPENSIIISSHLVNEIERMLDTVAFLKDGIIIFHDECEKVRNEKQRSIYNLYKELFSGDKAT